jgi:hypothetical protein
MMFEYSNFFLLMSAIYMAPEMTPRFRKIWAGIWLVAAIATTAAVEYRKGV